MFKELKEINTRPAPFQHYTAEELWTDEHTSKQMLAYHLNESIDVSSRNRKFIEQSVQWIASRFNVDNTTEIADFGCGPGLYASRLAEHGAKVTGIDFSKNSLGYARDAAKKKGLKIDYVQANYLNYQTTKKFDLIIMIMCDFCALSPVQRQAMLCRFYSYLKPDGSVLLDVYSMNAFSQKTESTSYERNHLNNFWSPDDYYCFVNTFKYEDEKVILDKYTIIEESQTREVYNWLQHFSKESLTAELMENGFTVSGLFSNVAGGPYDPDSPEFALIAKKEKRKRNGQPLAADSSI